MKPRTLVAVGGTLLAAGSLWGLLFAPAEVFMGDVYRIFYIHVPTAWNGLLLLTAAFLCAIMYLLKGDLMWDDRLEASMEAGVVLSALLTIQGSIWARPTWGVWWNWDPRLTTTAILVFAFAGILALRTSLKEPRRRAMVTAVATIVAAADVPLVYFSVRFWNSLHQIQSSPETVSAAFVWPLRVNAIAVLILMAGLIQLRAETVARLREAGSEPPPLDEPVAGGAA
ncbi:MAG TPA: cytochrome c biogenesis protein CcsA [Vicinamibacteria bacterium]|nr:cytochrome c biogenesis protein CcsA [Vicinamibacteria bacterium]